MIPKNRKFIVRKRERGKREIENSNDKGTNITSDNEKKSTINKEKGNGNKNKITEKIVFENILKLPLLVYRGEMKMRKIVVINILL